MKWVSVSWNMERHVIVIRLQHFTDNLSIWEKHARMRSSDSVFFFQTFQIKCGINCRFGYRNTNHLHFLLLPSFKSMNAHKTPGFQFLSRFVWFGTKHFRTNRNYLISFAYAWDKTKWEKNTRANFFVSEANVEHRILRSGHQKSLIKLNDVRMSPVSDLLLQKVIITVATEWELFPICTVSLESC